MRVGEVTDGHAIDAHHPQRMKLRIGSCVNRNVPKVSRPMKALVASQPQNECLALEETLGSYVVISSSILNWKR